MFGFQVVRERSYHTEQPTPTGWTVRLPHSCDYWEIAGEQDTKQEAIDRLRSFLAEGTRALEFLESVPDDWNDHYGPQMDYRWSDDD